jgi:putative PEP-CTERM system histidine kinase
MSAFVLHDLKNVMAQIDLILANAQQHKSNPEFIDDTFETLEHTKSRMDKMLKQLTEKKVAETRNSREIDLRALIEEVLTQRCQSILPLPVLKAEQTRLLEIDADKFSNVMYHLVSNAQQATSDNGEVTVELGHESTEFAQWAVIKIIDDGQGMSQDFIHSRLFKPFDTTKGNAGMGIGAYDAKNFIEELGGTIEVDSTLGEGTVFTLKVPMMEQYKAK